MGIIKDVNSEMDFCVNEEWVKEFQNAEKNDSRLMTEFIIYVPGTQDHHLYVYRIEVPADRVKFVGGNV